MRLRDHLLTTIDLAATLVLAVEFALTGVRADLDLFGIAVLAFLGAVGGGVMRDLLLGEHPPAALRDRRYAVIALTGAAAVAVASVVTGRVATWTPPELVDVVEAAGLALATLAGSRKAIEYGLNGASVIVIAVINGCGGGVLRDILTAHVPRILRADFYATAAMAGAVVMVVLVRRTTLSPSLAALMTGATVFAMRTAAIAGHWSLPHLR